MVSRHAIPAELPLPVPQPNVFFKANCRQAYIGEEAAKKKKKETRRALKREQRESQLKRIENKAVS